MSALHERREGLFNASVAEENGKTALISLLNGCEVGFGSTEFIVLRGKEFSLSAFAAQLSRSASFRQFAISNMTGTSGRKRIDASTLETFSLPLSPKELLLKYEEMAGLLLKRMTNNARENQRNEDRIHIWREDEDYIVVLADRKGFLLPWTAFLITREHTRRKLRKEYEVYWKNRPQKG